MAKIAPYAKAVIGAVIAFLSSLITALGDNTISPQEWITAVIAFLTAGLLVFAIPNAVQKINPPAPPGA